VTVVKSSSPVAEAWSLGGSGAGLLQLPDERAGLIGDCEILIVGVAGSCLLPSKGLPQTESRSERSPVPFPVCEPMMNGNRWESRIMTKSGSGVVRLKE